MPSIVVNPSPPWHVGDQVLLIASGFPPNTTVYFLLDHPSRRLLIGSSISNEAGVAYFVYTIPSNEQGYPITYCLTIGFLAYESSVGGSNIVYGHVTIYPPDFKITSYYVPLYSPPGSSVTFSYTITNYGMSGTERLKVTAVTTIRDEDIYLERMGSKTFTETVVMPDYDLIIKITLYEPVYGRITDEKELKVSSTKLKSKIDLRITDAEGRDITEGIEPLDIYLRGRLYDPINNYSLAFRTIKIYENNIQITSTTTDYNGNFIVKLTKSKGTYSYYAEWDGDETYEGC